MEDGSIISIASGTRMTIRAYAVDACRPAAGCKPYRSDRDCCAPWSLRSPGRQGSKSIPPSAPPRCARRTGLSRRSPAAMQVGCSDRYDRDDQRCDRGERYDPGTLGSAAGSHAQSGAAARVEPGGVRCGHRPHRIALERAGLSHRGVAWPRGSREAGLALSSPSGVMLGSPMGAGRVSRSGNRLARFALPSSAACALAGPEIAVVLVDEPSLSRLGRWPLSRRLYAKAVEILDRAGARVIAFDLLFAETGTAGAAVSPRGGAGGRRAAPRTTGTRRSGQTLRGIADNEPDADFAAILARERQGICCRSPFPRLTVRVEETPLLAGTRLSAAGSEYERAAVPAASDQHLAADTASVGGRRRARPCHRCLRPRRRAALRLSRRAVRRRFRTVAGDPYRRGVSRIAVERGRPWRSATA